MRSFYPAIAAAFSNRVYAATQSAIHVLITHAFLNSLARLDLATSRTGRFAPRGRSSLDAPLRASAAWRDRAARGSGELCPNATA